MIGFVSLISALAWPVASLAIAALFRRELRLALNRLGQLKYGGIEMTFHDDLRHAEALAAGLPPIETHASSSGGGSIQFEMASDAAPEPLGALLGSEIGAESTVVVASPSREKRRAGPTTEALQRLCRESPRNGILEAWDELARGLVQAATHLGDRRGPAVVRVEPAVRFLVDRGWLRSAEGRLVEQLRALADHIDRRDGPTPSSDDARRFVTLVAPLVGRLATLG